MAHGNFLPCAIEPMHKDQILDIFIKSMVSLKISILQIWVTWASKITIKILQLCSIKIKGSHTPWTSHAAALYHSERSTIPSSSATQHYYIAKCHAVTVKPRLSSDYNFALGLSLK